MGPPQRWPPELNEDVTADILLRIPPDDPADLVRASVVCKKWLRFAANPAFLCRYRALHRGAPAPLLGFFYNPDSASSFPGFVPTMGASSPPQPWHNTCVRWVSDCRHGRVLLKIGIRSIIVWDPFSNHWEDLKAPRYWNAFESNAVVLCAVPGCDHRSCHGGPFHVVFVAIDKSNYRIVHAHVYSSESHSWRTPASAQIASRNCFFDLNRAVLIGDGIYCTVDNGDKILKYDLVEHRLSLIGMPYLYEDVPVLMQNNDGSLGIAGVLGSRLHLWSTMVNAEGITGWVKQRVIKLKEIVPLGVTSDQVDVIGFAEGVEVFFISTSAGAFTFELKSGKVRKVGEPTDYHGVTPFVTFLTPDRRCSKWTK